MDTIDATKLAGELDRSARNWTPERLLRVFLRHGCAVVRGAIDTETRTRVKSAIEAAYAVSSPEAFHVYNQDIEKATDGGLTGWELVDTPLLQDFLSLAYRGQDWQKDSVTARRIQGAASDPFWQKPLDLHLDCQFHQFQFVINFWTPFESCGVDAPSLQLVPVDYRTTRSWSRFIGREQRQGEMFSFGYFRPDLHDPNASIAAFGSNCFFRPIMEPGDIIVSSNWILHGSYRTPQMTRGRTNAEIRFTGSHLDLADPPPSGRLTRLASVFR